VYFDDDDDDNKKKVEDIPSLLFTAPHSSYHKKYSYNVYEIIVRSPHLHRFVRRMKRVLF
jgi:hypothetical protein